MYHAIVEAKPLDNYRLLIKFDNGEEKVFDMTPYLGTGKFVELRDIALFNSVTVKYDTVEWANKLDLDPEMLYEKSAEYKASKKKR